MFSPVPARQTLLARDSRDSKTRFRGSMYRRICPHSCIWDSTITTLLSKDSRERSKRARRASFGSGIVRSSTLCGPNRASKPYWRRSALKGRLRPPTDRILNWYPSISMSSTLSPRSRHSTRRAIRCVSARCGRTNRLFSSSYVNSGDSSAALKPRSCATWATRTTRWKPSSRSSETALRRKQRRSTRASSRARCDS